MWVLCACILVGVLAVGAYGLVFYGRFEMLFEAGSSIVVSSLCGGLSLYDVMT